MTSANYIGSIDQGTTSTRFIVFDRDAIIVARAQREHRQILPHLGWVEHDPNEIWQNTQAVICEALLAAGLAARDLVAVGIANQRCTTLAWDRSGIPLYNAIVWQDTRTQQRAAEMANDSKRIRQITGLPLAPAFSGHHMRWLLQNCPDLQNRVGSDDLLFGTMDSWLVWNLTGRHITDATNASLTQLMNLETLEWDSTMLDAFGIPSGTLPRISPSSALHGVGRGVLEGVPIAGIIGDQQAALVGHACFNPGDAKNTYGTGSVLVMNTGERPVLSDNLMTTVAYKLGDSPAAYALEGPIAVTGSLIRWLRDNLGMIGSSADIEALAATVQDNGGVYIVPAFSGLYAPHWRFDARGTVVGLTQFANRGHIARAALEAAAYQTLDVVQAMVIESGLPIGTLAVDGGMTVNELLMQFQSDILNIPVQRSAIVETTALGAAYAAGLATGFWATPDELARNRGADRKWVPTMKDARRDELVGMWKKAVSRSLDWA